MTTYSYLKTGVPGAFGKLIEGQFPKLPALFVFLLTTGNGFSPLWRLPRTPTRPADWP